MANSFPWQELYLQQQQINALHNENAQLQQAVKHIQEMDQENKMLQQGIRALKQELLRAHEAAAAAQQAARQAQKRASAAEQLSAEVQRRADSDVQLQQAVQAAKAQADSQVQMMKASWGTQLDMMSRALQQEQHKSATARKALETQQNAAAAAERKANQLNKKLQERHSQYGEVLGRLREVQQQAARQEQESAAQEARLAAEIQGLRQDLEVMQQCTGSNPGCSSSELLPVKVPRLEGGGQLSQGKKSEAEVAHMRNQITRVISDSKAKVEEYRKACQATLDEKDRKAEEHHKTCQQAVEAKESKVREYRRAYRDVLTRLEQATHEVARLKCELKGGRTDMSTLVPGSRTGASIAQLSMTVGGAPCFLPGLPMPVPPSSKVLDVTSQRFSAGGSAGMQPPQPAEGVLEGKGQLSAVGAPAAQGTAVTIPHLLSTLLQAVVQHREGQGTSGQVSREQTALQQALQQCPSATQQALCGVVVQRAEAAVEQVRQRGLQQGLQLAFTGLMADSGGTVMGLLQQRLPAADSATMADVHRAIQLSQLQQFQHLLQQQLGQQQ